MRRRIKIIWAHPKMDKWGRLALLFLLIIPCFFWFETHPDLKPGGASATDQFIHIEIVLSLTIGLYAATRTTEKFYARSLGLYGCVLGATSYFLYIFLFVVWGLRYTWVQDFTRACFFVSAPLFAIATLITSHRQHR
jgi:hypothetical protein